MGKNLLIQGGLVIDPLQKIEGLRDVWIQAGKIAALGKNLASRRDLRNDPDLERVDARGCWVIPGIIDMHVHLREPGQEEAETVATGTSAAAKGGVTAVVAMPNTKPPIDSPARVRWLQERARRKARVHVLVAGAVTLGQEGRRLTRMKEMAQAGVAAFSEDGRPVMNAELMRQALEFSKDSGLPVLDHAEDLHMAKEGVIHEGACSRAKGLEGIPAASETQMAQRDIMLAQQTGGALHLCHVSCAKTVDLLRRAKARGAPVSAEAAPHHFTLVDEDIPDDDANFKMRPPLRGASDRQALIEGLADGTIDAIATDHAPHPAKQKALGLCRAPFGIIGLETLIPLSLALVRRRALSRTKLVERLSVAPARILNLASKGSLRPGCDADVTVIDPQAHYVLQENFASKSRNSPFIGWRMRGRARATIVAGQVVYDASGSSSRL